MKPWIAVYCYVVSCFSCGLNNIQTSCQYAIASALIRLNEFSLIPLFHNWCRKTHLSLPKYLHWITTLQTRKLIYTSSKNLSFVSNSAYCSTLYTAMFSISLLFVLVDWCLIWIRLCNRYLLFHHYFWKRQNYIYISSCLQCWIKDRFSF